MTEYFCGCHHLPGGLLVVYLRRDAPDSGRFSDMHPVVVIPAATADILSLRRRKGFLFHLDSGFSYMFRTEFRVLPGCCVQSWGVTTRDRGRDDHGTGNYVPSVRP